MDAQDSRQPQRGDGQVERISFADSIQFRTMLYLTLGIFAVGAVSVAVFYFTERSRQEARVVREGVGYLDTFVEQSAQSIEKGQPRNFQAVMDNIARIDAVVETGMYSTYGLLVYRSGVPTAGMPFVHTATEEFVNPNLDLLEAHGGDYRRPRWNLEDRVDAETPHATERAGRCGECHFPLPDGLEFGEDGRAHRRGDGRAEFFYRLAVAPDCIRCHTNWTTEDPGGWLRVVMDTTPADEARAANVRALAGAIGFVLLASLCIVFVVFRKTIVGPVQKLVGAADRLARGDVKVEIEEGRRDEVGQLNRRSARSCGRCR